MDTSRRMLQLAAMPVFLMLAVVNYGQPSPLCTVPGPYGFLTSMWFMYLVMAVAHSVFWFPILGRLFLKDVSASLTSFEPCCAPAAEAPKRQDLHSQSRQLA
ncbi:MAG: hypothetical protein ACLPWS_15315 [Rhodomicrobium sp.]